MPDWIIVNMILDILWKTSSITNFYVEDIPHNFYDENGIFHCSLIDLLLGRVELF